MESTERKKFEVRSILRHEDVLLLRSKSEPVAFSLGDNSGSVYLDIETKELIKALKNYVVDNHGLGMSAVQLGVLKRVFVMRKPWNSDNLVVVINPKIQRVDGKAKRIEQCFSIPTPRGIGAYVERPSTIWCSYDDENGDRQEDMMIGVDARIFLHELSHLNGDLMLDNSKFGKFIKWLKQ